MRIAIHPKERQAIARYGEAAYPGRGYGLLLGRSGENGSHEVIELLPWEQSRTSQEHEMIPFTEEMLRQAEEMARQKGLEVIGFFQSNPDYPARPSIQHRRQALPRYSYVIVGVRKGRAHELTAWRLSDDRSAFHQIDIRLPESGKA